MKLEISLFRFDKNSDYLPYYTKHFLILKGEKTLLDILKRLNKEENFGFNDSPDFELVVNKKYLQASALVVDLIEKFGNEFVIEPISIVRAYKDLLISEDDFIDKFELLEEFCTSLDKEFYLKQKLYYYASISLNYNKNYIGDAIFLLANRLINESPNKKDEILNKIKKQGSLASLHTNLESRVYDFDLNIEKNIIKLYEELEFYKDFNEKIIDFKDQEIDLDIKYDFHNFNIAYFNKSSKFDIFLEKLNANFLNFEEFSFDLNLNNFHINPKLTYFIASQIILSAYDGGADFLLVFDNKDFFIFNNKIKEIEKISNREIPLPVIHISELLLLSCGDFEKAKISFKNHKINPKIV